MALRAKDRLDEAESAGLGGSKHKDENEVWAVFRRNPGVPDTRSLRGGVEVEGTGPIFLIPSLLVVSVTSYSALLTPRTEKNWRPSPPPEVVLTGPGA